MTDLLMPPEGLGVTLEDLQHAMRDNLKVRYWPLRDAPSRPHVGWVSAYFRRTQYKDGDWHLLVWLTGNSGFVCATHCEVLHD